MKISGRLSHVLPFVPDCVSLSYAAVSTKRMTLETGRTGGENPDPGWPCLVSAKASTPVTARYSQQKRREWETQCRMRERGKD